MAAVDTLRPLRRSGLEAPDHAFAITPDDDDELPFVTVRVYVGTTGDLAVVTAGGETVTYPNVPNGWHVLRVRKVLTATTASGLIGEYP